MVSYLNAALYGLYGLGGIVVAGVALLVAFQEKLVYVPVLPGLTKSYPITPARLRLKYEDIWLRSSDGVRLHAWFIKLFPECPGTAPFYPHLRRISYLLSPSSPSRSCRPLGERALAPSWEWRLEIWGFKGWNVEGFRRWGHIAHRLEFVRVMLQRLQCNVFMLSYRGYGDSDGYPSQNGIIKDAQAALDHLTERTDIDTSRIVVFGRSLGGAVGSVAVLILENTFTSILDMAGVLLPFLKWFIGGSASKGPKVLNCLVRSPWSTIDVIGEYVKKDVQCFDNPVIRRLRWRLQYDALVKQPVLFLSGLQDEMVPPSHMRMLYDKAADENRRCLFVDFPTGMHMDTWLVGGDRYWRSIQLFLEQNLPKGDQNDGHPDG
ncbi:hypothetical protein ACLOJK_006444 [Asimina triloba]